MSLVLSKKPSARTPLSKEEEDDLYRRSSKKSKNGLNVLEDEEWPKLENVKINSWQQGQSFAEKLKGINGSGEEKTNAGARGFHSEDMLTDKDQAINFSFLSSDFMGKRGVVSLINIGHGYFVVKLTNKEDFVHALTGGPWMIFDHYLTIRPWEPQFNPKTAKIDRVVCMGEDA
ncbi:hypothetical protein K1719_006973 [Acacia pycnantha]|nr:hypothetical protein K1719_006973 [Acacia pycnantha]